jgi:hypothetical protein
MKEFLMALADLMDKHGVSSLEADGGDGIDVRLPGIWKGLDESHFRRDEGFLLPSYCLVKDIRDAV